MKRLLLILLILGFCQQQLFAREAQGGSMPLFMENKGQLQDQLGAAVPEVLFSFAKGSFRAHVRKDGIQYYFLRLQNPEVKNSFQKRISKKTNSPEDLFADTTMLKYTICRLDVQLLGANPNPTVVKEGRSDYYENYYLPGCGDDGVTDVHGYEKIVFKAVYPGIDWVVYQKDGRLEYDFNVRAGADASQIKIAYKGAEKLHLNPDGSLTATTAMGGITEDKPSSFSINGRKQIASQFALEGNVLSFRVNQPIGEDIVIDPIIDWGTYFYGDTSNSWQNGIYADGISSVYISGYTESTVNLATTGSYQTSFNGAYDGYLARFDSFGTRLWATYYGGQYFEYWSNISGDGGANVVMSGYTNSTANIATPGAHQATLTGNFDCFLAKFSSAGVLSWATYYGGALFDRSSSCAVDGAGNVYLCGTTSSVVNIASAGAHQTTLSGPSDAFLAKFNSAGVRQWGTYYGGTGDEWSGAIATSGTDVYFAGTTASASGIATAGSYQTSLGGGMDAFLVKFNATGARVWGTYFGGGGSDGLWGGNNYGNRIVDCDNSGNIYLTGGTNSTSGIATAGAYQTILAGGEDVFLVKFDNLGARQWGTYFGAANYEYAGSVSVDNTGTSVIVSGSTTSAGTGIASFGAYQSSYGGGPYDGFFAKFATSNGQLGWSSYLGGAGYEWNVGVDYEDDGNFYVGGFTTSNNGIATAGSYQSTFTGGNYVGFLNRFADSLMAVILDTTTFQYCTGDSIHIPFHGLATFLPGNVFTAELSNSAGSFLMGVTTLGSISSSALYDTIHAVLPTGISGSGYRIRVTSSAPGLVSNIFNILISPFTTPVVTISPSPASVCANGLLTFTATITNGGAAPAFQWMKNGVAVGTGATYTATGGWAAGDVVYCIGTSNAACTANPVDTSNMVSITILPDVLPVVTVYYTPSATICPGQAITFTAATTYGGSNPTFQWKVNGVNVGTSSTYTANNFSNGDVVTCVMTSSDLCATPQTVTSNATTVTISTVTPTVTISSGNLSICPGQSVSFTATSTYGGTSPVYQWKVNGVNAGTNSTSFTATGLSIGDVVTCELTSNHPCASPTVVLSNTLTIVSALIAPTISISAPSLSICPGQSVTFTATITTGGTNPAYQWKVNGVNAGTNSATFTASGLSTSDVVTCVLTSNSPCASPNTATSNTLTITVGTVAPTVAITASTLSICPGQPITFTATNTTGGTSPAYQWKVNGINAGTNSATFTSNSLTNGDVVTCVLTSNSPCANPLTATSNALTITVGTVAPTITITSTSLTGCPGQAITFTATTTTGGTSPTYQWKVNGVNVGTNSSTYTSSGLSNNDVVTCVLTSNSPCASPLTATSNALTTNYSLVQPGITITSSGLNICPGQTVSFTSSVVNGGTNPSYQWKVNGVNGGINSPVFSSSSLANGDVVTCVVTSNNPCAVQPTATSNALTIIINTVTPTISITANDTFYCYGKPATFTATITNGGSLPQYHWKRNGQAAGPNGPVYKDSTFVNGDVISCVVASSNPCAVPQQVASNQIVMKVSAILNPIIIRVSDGLLEVNTAVTPPLLTYQWWKNNSPIPGATNPSLTIVENAMYQVYVTDSNGCLQKSAIAWIDNLSIGSSISKEQIKIYPNPTNGIVQIEAPELLNATVRNVIGQTVLRADKARQIDISALASGVYMLFLTDKEDRLVTTVKLTKTD